MTKNSVHSAKIKVFLISGFSFSQKYLFFPRKRNKTFEYFFKNMGFSFDFPKTPTKNSKFINLLKNICKSPNIWILFQFLVSIFLTCRVSPGSENRLSFWKYFLWNVSLGKPHIERNPKHENSNECLCCCLTFLQKHKVQFFRLSLHLKPSVYTRVFH